MSPLLALIRGGGELGTGVGLAFVGAGVRVLVVDRPRPTALRLGVAFAGAAVEGEILVEGIRALHCGAQAEIEQAWQAGAAAVWTGDEARLGWRPDVLVDARLRQLTEPRSPRGEAALVIGLGPGFVAGRDVDYVIETSRGPRLGAVIAAGEAERHTGIPGEVGGYREERVLRAPRPGSFVRVGALGDFVEAGAVVGEVAGEPVRARISGTIRGLKLSGVEVGLGHKVGDVDPRRDPRLPYTVTDKAHAVGQGALQALVRAGRLAIAPGR